MASTVKTCSHAFLPVLRQSGHLTSGRSVRDSTLYDFGLFLRHAGRGNGRVGRDKRRLIEANMPVHPVVIAAPCAAVAAGRLAPAVHHGTLGAASAWLPVVPWSNWFDSCSPRTFQ